MVLHRIALEGINLQDNERYPFTPIAGLSNAVDFDYDSSTRTVYWIEFNEKNKTVRITSVVFFRAIHGRNSFG